MNLRDLGTSLQSFFNSAGSSFINNLPPVRAFNQAQQNVQTIQRATPIVQPRIQQAIPLVQASVSNLSEQARQVYNQIPPIIQQQIPTSLPRATYNQMTQFAPIIPLLNRFSGGQIQNQYEGMVRGTIEPFIGAGASALRQPNLNLPWIGSAPNLQTQQRQGSDFLLELGLPQQIASPVSTAGLALNFLPLGQLGSAKAPATEKAVMFLRNKLTKFDIQDIGKFAELIETRGSRAVIDDPVLNNRIQSLAANVFGPEAETWSNQKIKNVFDLVLQKIGTQPNRAGLGLSVSNLRQGEKKAQTIEEQLNNLPPIRKYTKTGNYSNLREADNPLLGTTEPLPWESEGTFMKRMKIVAKRNNDTEKLAQYSQADILQQGGQAQINAIHKSKKFNELFAHWIGKRDAARTLGTEIGAKFKDIPTSEGRAVIESLESGGNNKYVKPLHDEFNRLYRYATDNGIDIGFRENYITHIWDKEDKQVMQAYQVFKQREGFQNERTLPTYAEGLKMGLQPKFENPAQIITEYGRKMEQLKANLFFFKQLKDEGLVVGAAVGSRQPGFIALSGAGFPRSISKGYDGKVVIGSYYAPESVANKINKI